MKPLKLVLRGFAGVHYAFGRENLELDLTSIPKEAQLVALVGPIGAGKTTIMDNLHPYRVMPSRSSTLGPGGFSYWDNITSPTALKDLEWEHDGTLYRSTLSFKVSGKTRKADSYLYQWDSAESNWTPVQLADGCLSDGKADTYDRCIDAILGPPERFFTAQFSAQKRKSLADYNAGDIKSILASVLSLQNFRELSAKAQLVAKFLRQKLDMLNDELADARGFESARVVLQDELQRLDAALAANVETEATSLAGLDFAKQALAVIEAKRDSEAKDVEQARFLNEQIALATSKAVAAKAAHQEQCGRERLALTERLNVASQQVTTAKASIITAQAEVDRLTFVLDERDQIANAVAVLPVKREQLAKLDETISSHQVQLRGAAPVNLSLQAKIAEQSRIKSEGSARTISIKNLTETAALIDEVPCKGTQYQTACKLLGKANEAATLIPQYEDERNKQREAYTAVTKEIEGLNAELQQFAKVETALAELQVTRKTLSAEVDDATKRAARAPLIADAEIRKPQLIEAIAKDRQVIAAASECIAEVTQLLGDIGAKEKSALAQVDEMLAAETQTFRDRLAMLAAPITEAEVTAARVAVSTANTDLMQVRTQAKTLGEQKIAILGKLEAQQALADRASILRAQASAFSDEIALWKQLEKGLGNDGCVALSIDDAGPEIAAICNRLLSDCFDGRFAVRLDTQRETQAGNLKETFEVKVFDGHRGGEKSLGEMSGGEQVLVNECLTRSIALYASQSSTISYQTLFTDETDGALDIVAKRTFMQMKRSVLTQGGYEREYFITHTPELWDMADHKINVVAL